MRHGKYQNYYTGEDVVPQLRKLIGEAEELVTLSVPVGLAPQLADELADALDRNVLVLVLLGGEGDPDELVEAGYPATVARYWEPIGELLTTCVVDYYQGLITDLRLHGSGSDDGRVFVFTDRFLGESILTNMLANHWYNGHELFTAEPASLPHTYDSFFHAVIDAAQHLQDERDLHARVDATVVDEAIEQTTVDGMVVNVRQSLVYPMTSSFPSENSLFVEGEDGVVSVGGPSAAVEDIRALRVELYEE